MKVNVICYRFKPFIGSTFCGNFDCQMREETVLGRAVPVFNFRSNVYDIACMKFLGRFAPFLIIADTGSNKQYLTAFMMNMPVVTATWFECNVTDRYALRGEHI